MTRIRSLILLGGVSLAVGVIANLDPQRGNAGTLRYLYGPYWTTEDGEQTLLVFNNPLGESVTCRITLFDRQGAALAEHGLELAPLESATLPLERILRRPGSGHLAVAFPAAVGRLPVTALVGVEGQFRPVGLLDERDLEKKIDRLEALVPFLDAPWQETRVILSNAGTEPVEGNLLVEAAGQSEQVFFSIGGLATEAFPIRHSRFPGGRALSLSVRSPRSSELLAAVFSRSPGGTFGVEVERDRAELTRRLAGFHDGGPADLLVVSDRAVEAKLRLIREDGSTIEESLDLTKGGTVSLSLDPAGSASSALALETAKPARLRAWIAQRGGSSTQALKDPAATVAYHSFPVRLLDGVNTRVLLYNPSKDEAGLAAFFHFSGGEAWTLPRNTVPAGGFMEIDLAKLRSESAADHFGRTVPEGDVVGQVKILQRGAVAEKLLVQAVVEDRSALQTLRLESCPICSPQPEYVVFSPEEALSGFVGDTLFLPPVMGYYDDGSSEDVTFFSEMGGYNPSIVQYQLFSVQLVGTGTTGFEAAFTNPFVETASDCLLIGAVVAIIIIVSQDPNTVEIASLDGVAKNGTANVQVTALGTPNLTLQLSTQSGTGLARFASNNSTTLNITGSTSVSVKGITESSTADNIQMKAFSGAGTTLDTEEFSVVWVTLALRNSGSVSSDNSGRGGYDFVFGMTNLGPFDLVRTVDGIRTFFFGVEIVGSVAPTNYHGAIRLNRVLVESRVYNDSAIIRLQQNQSDTSDPGFLDENPQSGGSSGKVYDLDAPSTFIESGFAGTKKRRRDRFRQWATLDDVQVSADFFWHHYLSIQRTASGDTRLNDVTGDNTAGPGMGKLTWDLK